MSALRCVAGFILACIAGAAVQVLFVLTPLELLTTDTDLLIAASLWLLLTAIHAMAISAPFALIALILMEKYAIRGVGYYLAGGVGIGLAFFFSRYLGNFASLPVRVVQYALMANVAAGTLAALVYWAVAGRYAGHAAKATTLAAVRKGKEVNAI